MIGRLAQDDAPFFLVSFMATTHPPFTSKHPYYSLYSNPEYRGESKFIMAKAARSLGDHPGPGRAEVEVRPRAGHRSLRRLREKFDDEVPASSPISTFVN